MKVDTGLTSELDKVPEHIKQLESAGYDCAMSFETAHDPFFPLLLAARNSEKIQLMTSIAVAFSRTPMNLANIGHDLNAYSKGRFILGLGSQIRPHITQRFSMPWSKPAARMREFVLAMRAIWANWHQGEALDFRGEFYNHTLMTPMFTPTNIEYGAPRIFLAAVGPLMAEIAGEVADGMICHSFTTEKYMREVTMPAIEKGLEKAGKDRSSFEVSYPSFVVTGETEEKFAAAKVAVCKQLAFYGSTPAYKPVLGIEGWGDLQPELNALSKQGKWDEMGTYITDEILDRFAVVGEPSEIVGKFKSRYQGMVDRSTLSVPFKDEDHLVSLLTEMRESWASL